MLQDEKKIDQVIGAIRDQSRIFDMDHYYSRCGSPCCIAGHTLNVSNYPDPICAVTIQRDAAILLGISSPQGSALFSPGYHFRNHNGLFKNPIENEEITRDQAIAVLEHLKVTGKVDWSVAGYDVEAV